MKKAATKRVVSWQYAIHDFAGILFILLMPFSIFWPLEKSISPEILPIYGSAGIYLTDLGAFLLILVSAVGIWKTQKGEGKRLRFSKQMFIFLPLLLIPLLGLITAPWAMDPGLAFYTAVRWFLALAVFFAWQYQGFNTERLMRVFLIGLAVQAVIGILQVIMKSPLGLPGEMALSIDRPRAAVLWLEDSAWLRAYGLTFHPNVLGGFLAVGLILGLRELKSWWGRILWWLMAAGLVLTFSRSAWLAGGLLIIPLAIWLYRQKTDLRKSLLITLGAAVGIGAVGAILLAAPILSRFDVFSSLEEYTSISGRGELMTLALQSISQHPLNGIGAGNFPLLAARSDIHDVAHSVHHVALLLGAEIGAVGIVLWYWLWLSPVLTLGKKNRAITPQLLSVIAAWLAVGLISLWDSYPWSLEAGRLLSVTLLAWIYREIKHPSIPNNAEEKRISSQPIVIEKKG